MAGYSQSSVKSNSITGWWLKALGYLVVAAAVCAGLLNVLITSAAPADQPAPAWATPATMTLKRFSPVTGAQTEPNLFNNLDCWLTSYRMVGSSEMRNGCVTETAFGWFDSDSGIVLFNGTDEGLPLITFSNNQVLAPWTRAANLVSLNAVSTGGSTIRLYKNALLPLEDVRNTLLKLTAKRLTAPPEITLTDREGQGLIVNSQSLAFSDGGSWLVAETLSGAFVRINLASLDMVAFAPAFGAQGNPALLKSRVAISHSGRYIAIANEAAASFKVYDLNSCTGTAVNLEPLACKSYDYRPFVAQQATGLQSLRHVRFLNDGLISFEALTTNPDTNGSYLLAPATGITSLIDYLGLGDSYTSGEGAFNYLDGTDTADSTCHLSINSYPLRLSRDLFGGRGHSVACSGAVINDVGSTREDYRGQVRNGPSYAELQRDNPAFLASILTNFVPGYLAQQRFVGYYQPGVITASIGGNDIGFDDIVKLCATPKILGNNTCFSSYEDRLELVQQIDRTLPRLSNLYRQLRAKAPGGRLYAIGYPLVADPNGNCARNVQLNQSELLFATELITYLNGMIATAANRAGVVYIDISQALAGHRLCETASHNVAVNGVTAGKDGGPFGLKMIGRESYHPNALGHQLIEQAIMHATSNLTSVVNPVAELGATSLSLLNAPKTGQAVTARQPAILTTEVLRPSEPSLFKVDGLENGLRPQDTYSIRLDGPTGPLIAQLTSDAAANLSANIIIPFSVTPGVHTITANGTNQASQPVSITQTIYIPVSPADADSDNLPDSSDSCPFLPNSGQDEDQDHIDDSCDGFIDQPPTAPTAITISSIGAGIGGGTPLSQDPTIVATISVLPPSNHASSQVLGAATTLPARATKVQSPSRQPLIKSIPDRTVPPLSLEPINWLPWIRWLILLWVLLVCVGLGVKKTA
jgi:hypothetical protein